MSPDVGLPAKSWTGLDRGSRSIQNLTRQFSPACWLRRRLLGRAFRAGPAPPATFPVLTKDARSAERHADEFCSLGRWANRWRRHGCGCRRVARKPGPRGSAGIPARRARTGQQRKGGRKTLATWPAGLCGRASLPAVLSDTSSCPPRELRFRTEPRGPPGPRAADRRMFGVLHPMRQLTGGQPGAVSMHIPP